MRRVWIAAVTLTLVLGGMSLWPQVMAAAYGTPLPGWFPRDDAGVLLVVREDGHQEELAFGSTNKGGTWLKAQSQSNLYDFATVKIVGFDGREGALVTNRPVLARDFEFAALPGYLKRFKPDINMVTTTEAATTGVKAALDFAITADFTLSYQEQRAAGETSSRQLRRTLSGPIEISHKRPMTFEPAVIEDLGFAVRARAGPTDLQIMLVAINHHQPRFAECRLRYLREQSSWVKTESLIGFRPVDGNRVASIPMSEIGSWMGHTLNTQIEVEVTAEGAAVTVSLKKPGT